jgi:hypothetical protein
MDAVILSKIPKHYIQRAAPDPEKQPLSPAPRALGGYEVLLPPGMVWGHRGAWARCMDLGHSFKDLKESIHRAACHRLTRGLVHLHLGVAMCRAANVVQGDTEGLGLMWMLGHSFKGQIQPQRGRRRPDAAFVLLHPRGLRCVAPKHGTKGT